MPSIGPNIIWGSVIPPLPTKSYFLEISKTNFFLKRYNFFSWEITFYCQFLPNPLSSFNKQLYFFQQRITK